MRFLIVAAILAAALYSYSAFAAAPLSAPVIVNTNGTTINSAQIANASMEGDAL